MAQPQAANEDRTPYRPVILVVDDHELGRKSLAMLLEVYGYDVIAVSDGAGAFSMMKDEPHLDYVLTDLRLPDLDGREVVQFALQLPCRPQVALITGWDIDDDESQQLGIDWVFLKPLNVQEIVSTLQKSPPRVRPAEDS